jgi:hypothetical protein
MHGMHVFLEALSFHHEDHEGHEGRATVRISGFFVLFVFFVVK